MVLTHVALSVNDNTEIKNFYEDILSLKFKYQFKIDDTRSQNIFDVKEELEVFVLGHPNITFEIFLTQRKEEKTFSHICLSYQQSAIIYENAKKSGYKTRIIGNGANSTFFIWDKSENLFEIKEYK